MRPRLVTFALLSLVATVYVWRSLEVRTSIVDFLPETESSELLRIARELSSSAQSRVAVFTLSARDDEQHRAAAKELASLLKKSGEVQWVRGGLQDAGEQEEFYQIFFRARLGLVELGAGDGAVPDEVLRSRLSALKQRLGSPMGSLTRELAPRDPLGTFEEFVGKLGQAQGALTLNDGQLTSGDGRWSVLFADVRAGAFEAQAQRRFERVVANAYGKLRAKEPSLQLEWTSVGRFAAAAEHSIRDDVTRISLFSTLGILLLYLCVFRSLREPLLVMLPIVFGSVISVALCQLLFGFVHGLSLAFGTSIIGVAEDFSTHYFTHRRESAAEESNEQLMKRLWPGMVVGGLTTAVGVLSLAVSGFPGLAQMAVFGAVGVLSALVCTRYVLPALARAPRSARIESSARTLTLRALSQRRILVAALVAAPLVVLACGAPRLRAEDGVNALRTRTPRLEAENERVQSRLGRLGGVGRVIVTLGEDDQEALRRAELMHQRLLQLPAAARPELRGVVNLMPSQATQLRRLGRLQNDPTLESRLNRLLREEGFVPEGFSPFFEELKGVEPATVHPDQLLGSSLRSLIAPFRVPLKGRVGYLTSVSTRDPGMLSAALSGLPGTHYLDQEALYSEAYGRFRERALTLSLWGVALVLATLWLRYRSLPRALLGSLPAVLGAAGAFGLLGLLGIPISFLNVIAVLLVLSMGVDYGVYALEAVDDKDAATTLGSVLLAAATSVLSFGLLGLSENPALRAIGITVAAGLTFCVSTSPVVLVLSRRTR